MAKPALGRLRTQIPYRSAQSAYKPSLLLAIRHVRAGMHPQTYKLSAAEARTNKREPRQMALQRLVLGKRVG